MFQDFQREKLQVFELCFPDFSVSRDAFKIKGERPLLAR